MSLKPEVILEEERIHGGTLRVDFPHDDGSIEGVALNNIQLAITETCTDFSGNKFGAYVIVPTWFWKRMCREWGEYHGHDWRLLPKNQYGGYMGMYSYVTIYVLPTITTIIIKPDIGTLTFEFFIGSTHDIVIRKEQLIKQYGFARVGYDTRLVFVPWWDAYGFAYAPISALLEWAAEDNYTPAVTLLESPPAEALKQWYNQGQIEAPVKEALVARIEGRKYYPALPEGEEDVEYHNDSIPGRWSDLDDPS